MDINHQKFTSTTWELEMAMEDQIPHNQIPFDTLWPSFPLQNHQPPSTSTQLPVSSFSGDQVGNQQITEEEEPEEELGAMKEMMFKIAAMQPVDIDPATIRRPKRRNVRISDDPQSVAARLRREKISEKIRVLQRLVPGGSKLDTASMLDEAILYVKFLKRLIRQLQADHHPPGIGSTTCPPTGDWPITFTSTNVHDSATTSSVEHPVAGLRYTFGGGGGIDAMCFNHKEGEKSQFV
ncbi:unnamed protein product [Ilex paraguariensis]|uniref:BHLH domain-containing protein n=1 Tax=Ilex paraguariensis TaxID=185542 RepID=A0ABC8SZK8_9AQUA